MVSHGIDTASHPPIKQAPRRVLFSLCSKEEALIKEMLDQGIVEESGSPWVSPIVLVAKIDGSTRFCVDYQHLNGIIKVDEYPLPQVDECLDLLSGQKYFSTLHLATGYWQVKMTKESQEKTAFTTHNGLYEFTIMPFGLCNVPATLQRLMMKVLKGLMNENCVVYLDDISVLGRTFKQHSNSLRVIFQRLREANLFMKPKKCHLAKQEVLYLRRLRSI